MFPQVVKTFLQNPQNLSRISSLMGAIKGMAPKQNDRFQMSKKVSNPVEYNKRVDLSKLPPLTRQPLPPQMGSYGADR